MFEHLFREFLPLKDAMYNDLYTITMQVVGGLLIAIPFCVIGLACIFLSDLEEHRDRKRIALTKLFGFFLISCGISRIINVLCVWHNYANIAAYIQILTGLLAVLATGLIPIIVKNIIKAKRLSDIHQGLSNTNKKIDDLKEMTEKLNNDNK